MNPATLSPAGAPASPRSPQGRRRFWRWLSILFAAFAGGTLALWVAVHRYDWAGPLVANTLRSVIGTDNVARLEDFVYAVEDRVNRLTKRAETPRSYWTVPPHATTEEPRALAVPPVPAGGAGANAEPNPELAPQPTPISPWVPTDVGPVHKAWAASGDGSWVPIPTPNVEGPPVLYKTLLHPDATRGWAEVFVVAMDLSRIEIRLMAGSREPAATTPEGQKVERPAKIPEALHKEVLAAFNGGFMTEHGGWGMATDGVTLVPPKELGCTLLASRDGSFAIGPYNKLVDVDQALWWRQGPECMSEDGKLHPGLLAGRARKWGATLDGETVIRRSAVGLDAERKTLFFAITNHTTAPVLARAMLHVGSPTVLQMDVNWSYPKFVLFQADGPDGLRKAKALAPGFEFSEDEYLRRRSIRDFFYLLPLGQSPGSGAGG